MVSDFQQFIADQMRRPAKRIADAKVYVRFSEIYRL
jgi:hypothetical protein